VFSLVLVSHEAADVTKQRFLNTLEELVQSLVAAGLCLQHPPAFPLRRLIGHALNRPTDWKLGSDRGKKVYQPQGGTKSTRNAELCFLLLDFQLCYRNLHASPIIYSARRGTLCLRGCLAAKHSAKTRGAINAGDTSAHGGGAAGARDFLARRKFRQT